MTDHICVFTARAACAVGMAAAVILYDILQQTAMAQGGTPYFDGTYWATCELGSLIKQFPFLSYREISNSLDKLLYTGLIRKAKYEERCVYALTPQGEELTGAAR